jgi:hypothetical protein
MVTLGIELNYDYEITKTTLKVIHGIRKENKHDMATINIVHRESGFNSRSTCKIVVSDPERGWTDVYYTSKDDIFLNLKHKADSLWYINLVTETENEKIILIALKILEEYYYDQANIDNKETELSKINMQHLLADRFTVNDLYHFIRFSLSQQAQDSVTKNNPLTIRVEPTEIDGIVYSWSEGTYCTLFSETDGDIIDYQLYFYINKRVVSAIHIKMNMKVNADDSANNETYFLSHRDMKCGYKYSCMAVEHKFRNVAQLKLLNIYTLINSTITEIADNIKHVPTEYFMLVSILDAYQNLVIGENNNYEAKFSISPSKQIFKFSLNEIEEDDDNE